MFQPNRQFLHSLRTNAIAGEIQMDDVKRDLQKRTDTYDKMELVSIARDKTGQIHRQIYVHNLLEILKYLTVNKLKYSLPPPHPVTSSSTNPRTQPSRTSPGKSTARSWTGVRCSCRANPTSNSRCTFV